MTALRFTGACWIVFVVYWAVTAAAVKPTAERQGLAGRTLHLGLLAIAIALIGPDWRVYPLNVAIVPRNAAIDILGGSLCVVGLIFAIWARWTLADNWSAAVDLKRGHELIQRGPYNYARHPIYTGMLMMFLGSALAIGRFHAWLGLLVSVAGFWIKLRQEEALLMRHFPDAYPPYRQRVKALVPFVF